MIFRGYIDESYDGRQDVFALSRILARAKNWDEFVALLGMRSFGIRSEIFNRTALIDLKRSLT